MWLHTQLAAYVRGESPQNISLLVPPPSSAGLLARLPAGEPVEVVPVGLAAPVELLARLGGGVEVPRRYDGPTHSLVGRQRAHGRAESRRRAATLLALGPPAAAVHHGKRGAEAVEVPPALQWGGRVEAAGLDHVAAGALAIAKVPEAVGRKRNVVKRSEQR